jgi:hypothetical protein
VFCFAQVSCNASPPLGFFLRCQYFGCAARHRFTRSQASFPPKYPAFSGRLNHRRWLAAFEALRHASFEQYR